MECSAWPQEQSTLHVQSISRWAPSNIGPYSQAKTLGGMMVFVSGQIALDPATMTLLADSAPAQAEQCLRNLEVGRLLEHDVPAFSQVARACIRTPWHGLWCAWCT